MPCLSSVHSPTTWFGGLTFLISANVPGNSCLLVCVYNRAQLSPPAGIRTILHTRHIQKDKKIPFWSSTFRLFIAEAKRAKYRHKSVCAVGSRTKNRSARFAYFLNPPVSVPKILHRSLMSPSHYTFYCSRLAVVFQDSNFYMWELTVFAIIATLGGLVGALFVACNKRLDLFRARHLSGPRRRFVEASSRGLALGERYPSTGRTERGGLYLDRI